MGGRQAPGSCLSSLGGKGQGDAAWKVVKEQVS